MPLSLTSDNYMNNVSLTKLFSWRGGAPVSEDRNCVESSNNSDSKYYEITNEVQNPPTTYSLGNSFTEQEQFEILVNFANKLINQSQDLDPEIVRLVDKNFKKLL